VDRLLPVHRAPGRVSLAFRFAGHFTNCPRLWGGDLKKYVVTITALRDENQTDPESIQEKRMLEKRGKEPAAMAFTKKRDGIQPPRTVSTLDLMAHRTAHIVATLQHLHAHDVNGILIGINMGA
jgi:hypothetical protein